MGQDLFLYTDRPDPNVFITLTVNTSVRLYDDFIRLYFSDRSCPVEEEQRTLHHEAITQKRVHVRNRV